MAGWQVSRGFSRERIKQPFSIYAREIERRASIHPGYIGRNIKTSPPDVKAVHKDCFQPPRHTFDLLRESPPTWDSRITLWPGQLVLSLPRRNDLGLDSLDTVDIVMALEEENKLALLLSIHQELAALSEGSKVPMAFSLAKSTFLSNSTLYFPKNCIRSFGFFLPFSTFVAVDRFNGNKKRQSVVVSALEIGGVNISKDGGGAHVTRDGRDFFQCQCFGVVLLCSSIPNNNKQEVGIPRAERMNRNLSEYPSPSTVVVFLTYQVKRGRLLVIATLRNWGLSETASLPSRGKVSVPRPHLWDYTWYVVAVWHLYCIEGLSETGSLPSRGKVSVHTTVPRPSYGTTLEIVRDDPTNNIPDTIFAKLGMQLHRRNQHPLGILKNAIYDYFDTNYPDKIDKFDDLCPIVSVKQNFDEVLVPADHVSRSYNDTYYVDSQTVLRCHTSAHQAELLRNGHTHFLVTGDVYRRDSIDSTHYPVFHQMEGVRVFAPNEWEGSGTDATSHAAEDLKKCLEGLARHLFGGVEMRWVDTYFPFTNPSFELEIYFQDQWMEVLGCGVTEQEILKRSGRTDNVAWAFGLGLERLAMVLFDIPDIRLFWSTDERFTSQFSSGRLGLKFKPFSKYPPCYKDMSFWISDSFTENNLCEVVRGIAGDLAEEVKLIDNFTNKKGMTSHCYRIAYRSMERSLTDEEINDLQWKVREQVENKLKVVLR
ncbi:Phenylalanine--tRNA ligase, chloroplastic/mitochondrial [Capsicum annuum]|nr:Phenylalanine--tRNA ligase, chloroplastic/mitochondrial [Capsicum annuum]